MTTPLGATAKLNNSSSKMPVDDDWQLLKLEEWTLDSWTLEDGDVFDVSEVGCIQNNVSTTMLFGHFIFFA